MLKTVWAENNSGANFLSSYHSAMMSLVTLGDHLFDLDTGRLTKRDEVVPVGGRALAVLTVLAAVGGTVTKDALLDAAWPGITVDESNLTVQIAALRKLLGDDTIVTVPRIGYRLRPQSAPPSNILPKVAVLPFVMLGDSPDDAYFANGIAEDLITALGRFRQLFVLSRHAAMTMSDTLAEAGVRYTVYGTLRRSGNHLRISGHLVETGSGQELWARHMDGTIDDLFAFQDRITEAVTAAIAPEIEAAEIAAARRDRPASMDAYDLYLRALPEIYSETEAGNLRAEALLERALALEPENGLILAHLAWVLEHRFTLLLPTLAPGDRQRALDCARAALRNAGGDARTLCHAAATLFIAGGEAELGVAVVERALAENPNNTMVLANAGVILVLDGQLDRAEVILNRCLQLGPGDPMLHIPWCALAYLSLLRGDPEAALARAMRSQAANPVFDPAQQVLIAALAHLGRKQQASETLARYLAQTPGITLARLRATDSSAVQARLVPFYEGLRLAGLPEA